MNERRRQRCSSLTPNLIWQSDVRLRLIGRCNVKQFLSSMALVTALVATAVSAAGCSDSRSPPLTMDAPPPDAAVDAPLPDASCEQLQRDHVNSRLLPGEESDVARAVGAVVGAADFPTDMPYCSGPRPASR